MGAVCSGAAVISERVRSLVHSGSGRSDRRPFPRRGGFDAAEHFFVDAMEAAVTELALPPKFTLAGHSMVGAGGSGHGQQHPSERACARRGRRVE